MITIEQYIKHIDNLKEMGVLSEDFHIIQYKDGCLLGVMVSARLSRTNLLTLKTTSGG